MDCEFRNWCIYELSNIPVYRHQKNGYWRGMVSDAIMVKYIPTSYLSPAPVTLPFCTWPPGAEAGKCRADTKLCCRVGAWLEKWAVGNGVSAVVSLQTKAPCLPNVTITQCMCFKSGLHRVKHSVITLSNERSLSVSSSSLRFLGCSCCCFINVELIDLSSFIFGDI